MATAAPGSDFNVFLQFQPVTQSMVKHGLENGGNSLGLEDVVADGPNIMWLIALTVNTPENQKRIFPLALEYRTAINEYAMSLGLDKDWKYLNYTWKDQHPLLTHGESTFEFLKSVSEKYDPDHVFQKLRKTGFKLAA